MVAFGFLLQNLGVGRDLRIIILLNNECSLSGVDTQTLPAGKKINFVHSQTVGLQNMIFPSYRALAPHTSHLVKLSLPNISLTDTRHGTSSKTLLCIMY